ncbi:MAG: TlpA family protein disulfide reductase [Acidimicrobiales bacterium]|jgi:cytochrome c biogenesis protein CcmG, thiol:disulfide interchange protein DsbE
MTGSDGAPGTAAAEHEPSSPVAAVRRGRAHRGKRWAVTGAMIALTVLVGAGLYAGLAGSGSGTGANDPLVDRTQKPAPNFSLPELARPARRMSLADFRGKPLVINFWASWCYPCQTEMPLLEAAFRSERGAVQFLGIDTNDTRSAALRFLQRVHVTYPSLVLSHPASPVVTSYGLIGLPITFFISPKGTVMGRHIGPMNAATLHAALELAFGRAA